MLYGVEDRGYATPCHVWTKWLTPLGYGRDMVDGKLVYAHRDAYIRAYGPIPPGLEIDHLCSVRACVRPDHLEAVTHWENVRRARGGPEPRKLEGRFLEDIDASRKALDDIRERIRKLES